MWQAIIKFLKSLFGSSEITPATPIETTPNSPAEIPGNLITLTVSGTLRLGDKNADVGVLQGRLKEVNYYNGALDKDFGPATETAVKAVQTAKGLTIDGIAGPKTLSTLNIIIKTVVTPDPVPSPIPVGGSLSSLDGLTKGTAAWYKQAYKILAYDKGYENSINAAAKRVLNGKARYQSVAKNLGDRIPWWFIGGLHNMESSCNFAGVLHNGEKIIGTGKKTTLVPKGRGPFTTWEAAAVDALTMKNYQTMTDWSIGELLKRAEAYNGTGYLNYHKEENTPYLWAQTNVNDGKGKYVADGKWDANANANGQTGFAAVVKELERLGEIKVS